MRIQRTGSFQLPGAPADLLWLFTAEGEKQWAPGWEPVWPEAGHQLEVGEVWTTHGPTTWVTVDTAPTHVRYARIAQDDSAGLVSVDLAPGDGTTTVTVSYDLTSLSDTGATRLAQFAEEYDQMLEHWRALTTAALTQ
jgi:hypothetical protein